MEQWMCASIARPASERCSRTQPTRCRSGGHISLPHLEPRRLRTTHPPNLATRTTRAGCCTSHHCQGYRRPSDNGGDTDEGYDATDFAFAPEGVHRGRWLTSSPSDGVG